MAHKWLFFILLAAAAGLGAAGCRRSGDPAQVSTAQKAAYHCPMHPTYVSDRPGDCPICGMRLVPIEASGQPEEAAGDVPARPEEASGRATVHLPPDKERLIGVRTAKVERRPLARTVRASGRVAYDPDLYNAVAEYREALRLQERSATGESADLRGTSDALARASVLKLRQMGLSERQIQRLGQGEGDPTNLLLSQKDGSVWVYAQIYEFESGLVKAGQSMKITAPALPGMAFEGNVVSVDTILDPATRTLRVRGEVSSKNLLMPEMFVDVSIRADLGEKLSAPREAILDSGERKIVFVKSGPGRFDPREVAAGHSGGDFVEILSGLSPGEEVVVSANFLIDSESRLKAALGPSGGAKSGGPDASAPVRQSGTAPGGDGHAH